MAKYELSQEWISENNIMIKKAYLLITDPKCKYDISSVNDVLKTIRVIDPDSATDENAKILSKILQLFVKQMNNKFKIKAKKSQRTIN